MKAHLFLILLLPVIMLLSFSSCENSTAGNTPSTGGGTVLAGTELADSEVSKAATALENGDFEGALDHYSTAVSADPEHGEALLGYSLLELMSVMSDSDIVALARDNLGLYEYPNTMNGIIEGAWFIEYPFEDNAGDLVSFWAPAITGEDTYDIQGATDEDENPVGDGYIDPMEKGLAAIAYFATHNYGFNTVMDTIGNTLFSRVNSVLSAIDDIPTDAEIVIPGNLSMIEDNQGNFQDVVVGQAEIQLIAAWMLSFRSQIQMAQVYDYSLPLEDYWNFAWDYMNGDTTMDDIALLATPFSGSFLTADALSKLGDAKADMQEMCSRLNSAVTSIEGRPAGSVYSFSPDSNLVVGYDTDTSSDILVSDVWSDTETVIDFLQRAIQEFDGSLAADGGTPAYIPTLYSEADPYDIIAEMDEELLSWPDGSTVGLPESFSFDFGAFYSSPVFAMQSLFELDSDGEPVFYSWNGSGFDTTTETPVLDGTDYFYYVKMRDISLNGSIDTSMFPQDDTSSAPYYIDDLSFGSGDTDGDYMWDTDETIDDVEASSNVDGVINLSAWSGTDDPAEYYWSAVDYTDPAQIPEDEILSYITLDTGTMTELRNALHDADIIDDHLPVPNGPVAVLDTDDLDGDAVYFALPMEAAFVVAHSLTAAGTDLGDIDEDGSNETSTGSFWWGLAAMNELMQ